tara:strand:+ start:1334 stop:2047 length:714 start_codon:yes stop_codon:yes gene_type:complete
MKELQETLDAVARSKVCARNYKEDAVPEELIEHLLKVATGGPYKQGRRYFDLYAITNAEKCNAIWKHTARPEEYNALEHMPKTNKDGTPTTFVGNAQVLAPVLFVFAACEPTPDWPEEEFWDPSQIDIDEEEEQNSRFAMGTGMGMLVLEANRQGLHTGNCVCFKSQPITALIKEWSGREDFTKVGLMVGAGYPVEEWTGSTGKLQMREHPLVADFEYIPPYWHDGDRADPKYYRIT